MSIAESVSVNYDLLRPDRKFSLAASSVVSRDSMMTTTHEMFRHLECDGETLDRQYLADNQFEVDAPPGTLGLLLSTPRSSEALLSIQEIEPHSPLACQVRKGDMLLAIDGEDVTGLRSNDVSRMIAQKREKKVRRLLFTRPYRMEGTQLPLISA